MSTTSSRHSQGTHHSLQTLKASEILDAIAMRIAARPKCNVRSVDVNEVMKVLDIENPEVADSIEVSTELML